MDIVRFKHKDIGVAIWVPAITDVLKDGKFWTRSLSKGKDCFGRDRTLEYFRESNPENRSRERLITPKMDYEMFELTTNPDEADYIAISYSMGTDFKKIVKSLGDKTFIVEDKVPITSKTKEVNPETGYVDELPYYDNTVLEYRAYAHHEKLEPKYEGDCNTEIKLHDTCKYKMYKFIGVRKVA